MRDLLFILFNIRFSILKFHIQNTDVRTNA